MHTGFHPTRRPLVALGACAVPALGVLLAGVPAPPLALAAAAAVVVLAAAMALDLRLSSAAWLAATPTLQRVLPAALAIGARSRIVLRVSNPGERAWEALVFDHPGEPLRHAGLPVAVTLAPGALTELEYEVTPAGRGDARFEPAELRLRSVLGLLWLHRRVGATEQRRVYPDFAQISRYAWLAGDRRLAELGVRSWQRRGEGTDFKQLAEYLPGDPIRHIDWKATLRTQRPVVRQFQDERDQNVLLLLDCGRRMRADEQAGGGHFDDVLNATVLLAYVALRHGDAVGVQTFGVPPRAERHLRPAKGGAALTALMAGLYDLQPTLLQPDYQAAAAAVMRNVRKRSLVVIITNFRDEDSEELGDALRLLRTRHLVLLASVRERALRLIADQPLRDAQSVLEVATVQLFSQQRRTAFRRLAGRDALMVDAEPGDLGVALVNSYRNAKSAGLL
jgi:uncharacterized protein (DUF58 family)